MILLHLLRSSLVKQQLAMDSMAKQLLKQCYAMQCWSTKMVVLSAKPMFVVAKLKIGAAVDIAAVLYMFTLLMYTGM